MSYVSIKIIECYLCLSFAFQLNFISMYKFSLGWECWTTCLFMYVLFPLSKIAHKAKRLYISGESPETLSKTFLGLNTHPERMWPYATRVIGRTDTRIRQQEAPPGGPFTRTLLSLSSSVKKKPAGSSGALGSGADNKGGSRQRQTVDCTNPRKATTLPCQGGLGGVEEEGRGGVRCRGHRWLMDEGRVQGPWPEGAFCCACKRIFVIAPAMPVNVNRRGEGRAVKRCCRKGWRWYGNRHANPNPGRTLFGLSSTRCSVCPHADVRFSPPFFSFSRQRSRLKRHPERFLTWKKRGEEGTRGFSDPLQKRPFHTSAVVQRGYWNRTSGVNIGGL